MRRAPLAFLLRRAFAGLLTVLAIITLSFVGFWAIPSEPAEFIYPSAQHLSNEQIRVGDHLLGVDRPKIVQYVDYLRHLAQGDFGGQWSGATVTANQKLIEQPIKPMLFSALGVTLSIAIGGAVVVLLLAIPLGAIAGRRIGSLADRTISLVTLIGVCTHPMVVGLILRSIFGENLRWAPPDGYCALRPGPGQCGGVADWAAHLALPWATFALLFLALYTRMVRASVDEIAREDFVRTARGKGASEIAVLRSHVLPNATLRLLTMVGMEIGTVIGVSVYVEATFGLFGLGRLGIQTMGGSSGLDLPLILAVLTVIALVVVIGNLVVDALYAFFDPRVGTAPERTRSKSLAGGVI
jgi:peptide/nickel transport system permease protein